MASLDPQIDWLVRELRGAMRKAPKRDQMAAAAAHAHVLYEANVAGLSGGHLACKAGCGSCCAAQVGAEMPEAFAIVRHLQSGAYEGGSHGGGAAALDRAARVAERIAGLDAGQRWEAQVFCAFLDQDTQCCTIYPVRPLACRGYTSTDLAACDASTATRDHSLPIPADAERQVRAQQLRAALGVAAARALGLEGELDGVELHAAVRAARDSGGELAWMRAHRKGL